MKATRVGLDLVGPRMNHMLDDLKEHVGGGPVLVHCWRGGMRSESVAWLLNFSGEFEASTLDGGYKSFRRFALDQFLVSRRLVVLGGMTGSGKTEVLAGLAEQGEQVIDLEDLANHRGSAFGAIGLSDQPPQQQFENDLAVALSRTDPARRLWLEDESRRIGRCMIPGDLWAAMRKAPCLVLERPRDERRANLVAGYGREDRKALVDAIWRIERRLGGAAARSAAEAVGAGDMETACDILLEYYDKTYEYGLGKRDASTIRQLHADGRSSKALAPVLVSTAEGLTTTGGSEKAASAM